MSSEDLTGAGGIEILNAEDGAPLSASLASLSQLPASAWNNRSLIVAELPRFDLDQYAGNYTGHMRINRLLFIGHHCPALAAEAFKSAISTLKKTQDVSNYKLAVQGLAQAAPGDPDAKPDEEWVDRTMKSIRMKTEKLEAELKSYKNNMIKESIRAGHEELGSHYYAIGDLSSAFKSYSRMRDYCTTPKHVLDMSLSLVLVSIEQGNYHSVSSNVAKIRNHLRSDDDIKAHQAKVTVATGISQLANGSFLDAARTFITTPTTLTTASGAYSEVASANDVAVYGGLCALASMDRSMLKNEVLDNTGFRNFLELEPHIRRAITAFHGAKYGECLSILDAYKNDYLLDIFLSKHVEAIYDKIRTKSIIQYFVPFSCVTLGSMAQAFDVKEEQMEKELVVLIEKDVLKARIDTQNRLVKSKETQLRASVHKSTLERAKDYEQATRLRLMRMNILRAGLEVKAPKPQRIMSERG